VDGSTRPAGRFTRAGQKAGHLQAWVCLGRSTLPKNRNAACPADGRPWVKVVYACAGISTVSLKQKRARMFLWLLKP